MRGPSTIVGRVLVVLALIVQIFAPVGSTVATVAATFDPLAEVYLCVHDADGNPLSAGENGAPIRHDACDLCVLVNGGGFAPPVDGPRPVHPAGPAVAVAAWIATTEPVAVARLLDHIRGRAPPVLS